MKKQKPTKTETIASVIQKRRNRVLDREGYGRLLRRIVLLGVILWLLFTRVFCITQAVGNGMFPAVKDGDLMIVFRLQQNYVADDVILYEADGETRVGRIVAKAMDSVTIDDSGTLIVNGTVQSGEIMYPTYKKTDFEYPLAITEGQVFVLGDYRTKCEDSRDFGPISLDDVKGKVITILRRRGL